MTHRDAYEPVMAVILVGIGGLVGSNLRYFVGLLVPPSLLATATVNILGCILIGLFLYLDLYTDSVSYSTRTVFVTGFIASFTTYSTFILDSVTARPGLAVTYIVGSYALGFLGVLVGRQLAAGFANFPVRGGGS